MDALIRRAAVALTGSLALAAGGLAALVVTGGAAPALAWSNCSQSGSTVTCHYAYTGAEQKFTVPAGVSSLQITAVGAPGATGAAGGIFGFSGTGGAGGTASVTVTPPASTLYVEVGGLGTGAAGGWNGGGPGGSVTVTNG